MHNRWLSCNLTAVLTRVEQWQWQQRSAFWRGTGRDGRRHCTKQRSAAGADAQPSGRCQRGRQLCSPQRPRGTDSFLACLVSMPCHKLTHAGYQASPCTMTTASCQCVLCVQCVKIVMPTGGCSIGHANGLLAGLLLRHSSSFSWASWLQCCEWFSSCRLTRLQRWQSASLDSLKQVTAKQIARLSLITSRSTWQHARRRSSGSCCSRWPSCSATRQAASPGRCAQTLLCSTDVRCQAHLTAPHTLSWASRQCFWQLLQQALRLPALWPADQAWQVYVDFTYCQTWPLLQCQEHRWA